MPEDSSTARWELAGVLLNRDARWAAPHLWRAGFLVALFLVVWSMSANLSSRAAPGLDVLRGLTVVSALGLVALATGGVGSLFRDEWLGNNLELVQLTGVGEFNLLLAKLIPLWTTAASLLLLEIPVFLLCVTLGGVTRLQVAAVVWQLAWLFLVASGFTVLTAAWARGPQTPIVLSLILLGGYQFLAWVIDLFIKTQIYGTPLSPISLTTPPLVSSLNWSHEFHRIFSSGFAGPILGWPVLVRAATIAGCLWLASRLLRKRLSLRSEAPSADETAPEGQAHQANLPVWRPSHTPPVIRGDAIEWKDYHFTLGGAEMITGKWGLFSVGLPVVLLVGLPVIFARNQQYWSWGPCLFLMGVMVILVPLATLVHMANRLWMQEIREQTLTSLVLLPYSAREIILAKLRALIRMSLPEIALYLIELAVIVIASVLTGSWIVCGLFVALMLSIPMVICTDAAWRFIPPTLSGLAPRLALVGMVLGAWTISGFIAGIGAPLIGLLLLAALAPIICHLALNIAAQWLGNHAGELVD